MRRRDALIGAAALAFSRRPVRAQERERSARIGFVVTGDAFPHRLFEDAMRRHGWILGRNLSVDRRVTGENSERRKAVAGELIADRPDVIVAAGTFDALPVFAATHTIPIVVIVGADLVENGLVESLAHPGGNLTGTTVLGGELDGKRLELLHELLPSATEFGVIGRKTARYADRMTQLQDLGHRLGIGIEPRRGDTLEEMDAVYGAAKADGNQAILQMASPLAFENQPHLIGVAARLRLPVIYEAREYVENGGLISYGQVWAENFERSASLVNKILNGTKPADLPVERPTKFELLINLKTAKALDLNVSSSLLTRADEVFE